MSALAIPAAVGRDRVATGLLAAGAAAVTGACTVLSPQLGCGVALVGTVVLLHLAFPAAGLVALWALWLVTPGLRRAFGLLGPYVEADPLSAAPVAATLGVALVALLRTRLDRETRRVLLLAFAGLAIGVPAGAESPAAASYALLAYGGGALAFAVGRTERASGVDALSLRRALVLGGPLLALYGIAQYFLPLTAWDSLWLATVEYGSIGAPEEGRVRVFSTLNGPGTLAPVLAVTLLCHLASIRARLASALGASVVVVALALTYVRSAWLAFAVAALVLAALARTRTVWLTVGLCAVLVAGALATGAASPTTGAFAERVGTFGALESDTSANARVATPSQLVPEAIARPLGHGLGSAGEASRLRPDAALKDPDNGYLSLLYQLGPIGFLLVLAAAGLPLAALAHRVLVAGARDRQSVLLFAVGVLMVLLMLGGDLFYGVTGVILWYVLGRGLAVARAPASTGRTDL